LNRIELWGGFVLGGTGGYDDAKKTPLPTYYCKQTNNAKENLSPKS
jgi:hypothetical protein